MRLRFHLGLGKNFMKWQITDGSVVSYYDPATTQILMRGCKLKNQKGMAGRIYGGEVKSVCAWVEFREFELVQDFPVSEKLCYNPRVAPFWVHDGGDVDNTSYLVLVTSGRAVCLP